jgi:RHS repeat-associated protein
MRVPSLSLPAVLAAAAVALLALPARASAQVGTITEPNDTPTVAITPHTLATHSASVAVSVAWGDGDDGLVPDSAKITLDGTPVSGFTWSGDAAQATSTGTLTLSPGPHTVIAKVRDAAMHLRADTAQYTYTPLVAGPPAVTPDAQPLQRTAGEPATERFTVTNTGTAPTVYTLTFTCGSVATQCSLTRPRVAVDGLASATIGVSYRASTTIGASGTVTVTATDSATQVADNGSVQVTTIASRPTSYVNDVGSDVWMPRSACLQLPAGLGGTYECGDLRLAYGFPATTVLGRTFAPTLLYSSAHARPSAIVSGYANPLAGTAPVSIASTLRFSDDNTVLSQSYPATGWVNGDKRRVAVMYDAAVTNRPAAYVRNYTSQIVATYADNSTQVIGSGTGAFAIVDRRDSPFGNGWWLAGLEQLYSQPDGSLLWVGGDGSTERYARAVAGDSVFLGDALDGPDSLVQRTGADSLRYERRLGGGAAVWFDALGNHRRTCNRLKQCSVFEWSAGKLVRIWLPTTAGGFNTGQAYVFTYANPGGKLSRVDAPDGAGARATTIINTDGRIQDVYDPLQHRTSYGYNDATGRIVSTLNARGTMTYWRYGAEGRLTSSVVMLPNDSIAVRYQPQEVLGLAAAVPLANVYTFFDGPRLDSDVHDYAWFWADRRGTPWRVKDALGNMTTVLRADPKWPALNTHVIYPNGREVTATYDDAGRLVASTDWSLTSGDGRHATTLYDWNTRWNEVTRVTSAEGVTSTVAFDTTTGLRLWSQAGEDTLHRTRFDYFPLTDYLAPGRVRSVTYPQTAGQPAPGVERYTYDANGNLATVTSARGFVTRSLADAIGRDTLVIPPSGARTRTVYNALSQATHVVTWSGTDSLIVNNSFDAGGLPTRVARTMVPDTNRILTQYTDWYYDAAGRRIMEKGPSGSPDSTAYNPAGQAVKHWSPRHDMNDPNIRYATTMHYDALGRLDQRITPAVTYLPESFSAWSHTWTFPTYRLDDEGATGPPTIPGDTATFTYDVMGNMRTANNRDARISRGYDLAGRLTGDTLRIRSAVGRDYSHAYAIGYSYDLDSRRTWMKHPVNAAAGLPTTDTMEVYTYEAGTGALSTLRDLTGHFYRFDYNEAGQLKTLWKPNGDVLSHRYDLDGQLVSRATTDPWASDSIAYDSLGKIAMGSTGEMWISSLYTGFGPLWQTDGFNGQEWVAADPLGNVVTDRHRIHGLEGDNDESDAVDSFTYQHNGSGRMTGFTKLEYGTHRLLGDATYQHDPSGNRYKSESREVWRPGVDGLAYWIKEYTRQYYDADEHLRVTDRQRCNVRQYSDILCIAWQDGSGWDPGAFEESRYDALGRRVWTRVRSPVDQCPGYVNDCADHTTRTIWDGDQVLWEIRTNGSTEDDNAYGNNAGRVGYTHAGLDAPLSMYRINYTNGSAHTLIVHMNWRGLPDDASFPGSMTDTISGALHISSIPFPAKSYDAYFRKPIDTAPTQWFGSIVSGSRDASGQFYRRNRFYDANSGQFTQEDPAGLAGGLNSYGFGGGDPVSYGDPYGLCPDGCIIEGAVVVAAAEAAVVVEEVAPEIEGEAEAAVEAVGDKAAETASQVGEDLAEVEKDLASRVQQVHRALHPIAQRMRTTAGAVTRQGQTIFAGGARDLSPAQRQVVEQAGNVVAKMPGAHAEVTILNAVQQGGLRIINASRTICPSCAEAIEAAGGRLINAFTAIWK